MHNAINLRMQKVGSYAFETFLSEEIDVYINLAINDFIDERYLPENNRLREGFEQSQKRIDDLRTLVKKNEELSVQNVELNAALSDIFVDRAAFPNDYRHLISTRCKINYNTQGIEFTVYSGKREPDGTKGNDYEELTVKAKPVQSDDIYMLLSDPFNKPRIQEPIYDISETGIDIYTNDDFIVDKIIINYIKEPAEVSLSQGVDTDLPKHTHGAIVDNTAKKILTDINQLGAAQKIESLTDEE